jgi:Fe-S cluster assembly protein SufD
MDGKSEIVEKYSNLYLDNIKRIESGSSAFVNSFREQAIKKFDQLGIPDRKNEAYKYTNLDIFFKHDYKSYFIPDDTDFLKAEEFRCDITTLDTHGIVLINGFYPTLNGKLHKLPGDVWIGSLNEAAKKFGGKVEEHYGRYAISDTDGLVHLNTAMASDGVFIHVPEGTVLKKPIQVVNLVDSSEDTFNQHRNLILI